MGQNNPTNPAPKGGIDYGFWLQKKDDRTDTKFNPVTQQNERRPRYFCALIRFRWNPELKKFEVCVLTYRQDGTGPEQIKFPGGCSNFNETPRQCLYSESKEETGRPASKNAKVIFNKVFYYKNGNPASGIEHIHFFFLDEEMEYYKNVPFLKTKSKSDDGECSPVRWEPLTQDLVDQFHRTHRPALEALHEEIMLIEAVKSLDKYDAVANLKF